MNTGGAERVVANLVNELSDKVNVYTMILEKNTDADYNIKGDIISLYNKKNKNRLKEICALRLEIKAYAEENEIDCVISFTEYPNLLNILTKIKIKKIISVRNFMSEKWKGSKGVFWRSTFKYLYNKADILISPTKVIENDMIEKYKVDRSKCKIIYNPYEIEKISSDMILDIEPEFGPWFNGETIITMGRLVLAKGHCHLIRAFSEVKKIKRKAKLVIIGVGELEKQLKELVRDLNIEKDVLFLGFSDNPHKYINKSNLFVLPSYYEGFPNALAEAMICKVPVISTDCKSGPREILYPSSDINFSTDKEEYADFGVLIPEFKGSCFDANAKLSCNELLLVKSIINLMNDKNLYSKYIEKSQQRITDFHIKNIALKWLEMI
ncbi:glycosyltransferase [Clostridium intestinale]|uniref:glycosyltransferase n=1 Tax=Clostridium intestinale TaxID=36845 RepID=UPI0028EC92B9|nr:glycosyltransferase [Clostridium intestinale]